VRIITVLLKSCVKLEIDKIFVINGKFIHSSRSETQVWENTDGYVIRRRHGRDFARDRRKRPTEKYETIDMRGNECSTMWNVQREETRRRARDTVSVLFARRHRENITTLRTHAHTLPRNNSISQKNFYIEKNLNIPRYTIEKFRV